MKREFLMGLFMVAILGLACERPPEDTGSEPENLQVCCGGEVGSEEPQSAPKFPSYDFGKVEQGDKLVHSFTVKNETGQEVRFEAPADVSYTCCMEVRVSPDPVPADSEAEVTVSFDTRLRPGPFDVFVRLFPSERGFPDSYHLGGMVRRSFVVEPTQLFFQEPGSLDFQVTGEGLGKMFQVTKVETNTKSVSVQEVSEGKYRATWDGNLFALAPKAPVIYVITDSEKLGWFPILLENPKERL